MIDGLEGDFVPRTQSTVGTHITYGKREEFS